MGIPKSFEPFQALSTGGKIVSRPAYANGICAKDAYGSASGR